MTGTAPETLPICSFDVKLSMRHQRNLPLQLYLKMDLGSVIDLSCAECAPLPGPISENISFSCGI